MEALLIQRDLSIALEGKSKKPTAMTDEEWAKLDRKAVATIRLSLPNNMLFNVASETTAKGLWEKLSDMYAMTSVKFFS